MSESLAEALSGAAGGAFSSFCVYPIEVVKTVMQVVDEDDDSAEKGASSRKTKTVVQVCNDIIREQGYFGFFKGVELGSLQSALQNFVRFYIYGALLRAYRSNVSNNIGFTANLLIGYVADLAHLPITLPIETISVRIQTDTKKEGYFNIIRNSLADGSCYNGLSAYWFLCFNPAIRTVIYDRLKGMFLIRMGLNEVSALAALFLGMLARVVASTLMYPIIRGRVILQGQKKSLGLWESLNKIIREHGVLSLYDGLDAELIRGVWSTGLKYMAKEGVEGYVKSLIV